MRAALLLFLCACAAPPAQYERGTMRPAPAPVRPGVGAPTVGQPGMRPDALPRGPYTRVLPPTREPGIWAADKPAFTREAPAILGVAMPNLAPEEETFFPVEVCTKGFGHGFFHRPTLADVIRAWPPGQLRCAALRLFVTCMKNYASEKGADAQRAAAIVARMVAPTREACTGADDSAVERWISDVLVAVAQSASEGGNVTH